MRRRTASVVGWEGWSPNLILSIVDFARPIRFALTTARSLSPCILSETKFRFGNLSCQQDVSEQMRSVATADIHCEDRHSNLFA